MRKAGRLGVDRQVDVTLLPAGDGLGDMPARAAEAERTQEAGQSLGFRLAGGEFQEGDTAGLDARGHPGKRCLKAWLATPHLVH